MTRPCGKTIHFSPEDAQAHINGLTDTYGVEPNVYRCYACSEYWDTDIYHVGYTARQASKLSKRGRRRRKRGKQRKQKQVQARQRSKR